MARFSLASRLDVRKLRPPSASRDQVSRASTFHSQQDYEDKAETVTGALGLPVRGFRPKAKLNDEEAALNGTAISLKVPDENAAIFDEKTTPRGSKAVNVPRITITTDDGGSDAIVNPSPTGDEPSDQKESYEFLHDDGRWHHKPHVYEYNAASARLLDTARPYLFGTMRRKDRQAPKKCVLNVATMQAMVLRTYQRDIVEAGKEMLDGKMSVRLPQLLHKYCDALRDMDYMQDKAANGFEGDPFLLMTSKQMERELMQDYGLLDHMEPKGDLPSALDQDEPMLPGLGRTERIHRAQLENKYYKFYSAIGGGLALIIPMIIMRLEPGTASCLVTTTGCVLVFSLVVALRSNMRPNDILAVTAAYTAVLVVFVGTTT